MYRLDDETEQKPQSEPNAFLEEALFKARTIMLTGGVDDKLARRICERLLALDSESDKPILLVVSSPGGHVESGDMIHDMIKFVNADVKILGSGWVASAGALIYSAAKKENRYALPNTRFLLHEPRGGFGGQASDIDIQVREIVRMRERLNKIFAEATGQPLEKIIADSDRDNWFNAKDALAYGFIDHIATNDGQIAGGKK